VKIRCPKTECDLCAVWVLRSVREAACILLMCDKPAEVLKSGASRLRVQHMIVKVYSRSHPNHTFQCCLDTAPCRRIIKFLVDCLAGCETQFEMRNLAMLMWTVPSGWSNLNRKSSYTFSVLNYSNRGSLRIRIRETNPRRKLKNLAKVKIESARYRFAFCVTA